MKKITRFFAALGDAIGLVILLGGLLIATRNLQLGGAHDGNASNAMREKHQRVVRSRKAELAT